MGIRLEVAGTSFHGLLFFNDFTFELFQLKVYDYTVIVIFGLIPHRTWMKMPFWEFSPPLSYKVIDILSSYINYRVMEGISFWRAFFPEKKKNCTCYHITHGPNKNQGKKIYLLGTGLRKIPSVHCPFEKHCLWGIGQRDVCFSIF